jgi:hypothetical protein
MRSLAFLSIILIIAGCKNSGDTKLPSGLIKDSIIPRSEMINMLVDIHVLEAALIVKRNKTPEVNAADVYYYDKLFTGYKMTRRRFLLNLSYYEMNPENLRKMYEEVVKKLEIYSNLAKTPRKTTVGRK